MNPVLLVSLAGGLLGAVALMLLVPPRLIRGVAVGIAIFVIAFGFQGGAPPAVWQTSGLVAISVLVLALIRARAARSGGVRFWAVSAWLGYISLGIVLTGSWPLAFAVMYFGLAGLLAWVVSTVDPTELRIVYAFIAATAAFQVALAGLELTVLPEPIWGYVGGARDNPFVNNELIRTQGTFGHPIPFAVFCGFSLLIAWSNPGGWSQKWRLINLSIAVTGLAFSGTRSAVFSIAIGLLVHIALSASLARWLRSVVVLAAIGVLLINIDVGIARVMTELFQSGSFSHRLGGLESVPALLEKRPPLEVWFGNGFGSAGQLYDRHLMHQIYMRTVDNMLVYALGTMGIVGLGALLALSVVTAALADRTGRAILAMVFAMYFSFDLWTWFNIGAFTCMFMAMPRSDRTVDGLVISRQALVSATPRMRS